MNRVFIFFFFSFAVHLALGLALISKTGILDKFNSVSLTPPAQTHISDFENPDPSDIQEDPPPVPVIEQVSINKVTPALVKNTPKSTPAPKNQPKKTKPLKPRKPKKKSPPSPSQEVKKPSASASTPPAPEEVQKDPLTDEGQDIAAKDEPEMMETISDEKNIEEIPAPSFPYSEKKLPADSTAQNQKNHIPEQALPKTLVEGTSPPLPIVLVEKPEDLEPGNIVHFTELRELKGNPKIIYPKQAEMLRLEGTVVVYFYVNNAGFVEKIHVRKSSGYSILDNAAIKTLSRYLYHPGQETWVQQPVQFSLKIPSKS